MNVLSLFDGMSCGQIALTKLKIPVKNYFASEVKKIAIKVTKDNYPDTIHLGDVTTFDFSGLPKIDLLLAGSPCQDFSIANKKGQAGLKGAKSSLFYYYLDILKLLEPKYFLLENVRMSKDNEIKLNNYLGVEGLHINSNLVSYQNRNRIYWTNIPNTTPPKDKNINFQDFKDKDIKYCKEFKVNYTPSRIRMWNNGEGKNSAGSCSNITKSKKINCLTRKQDRCPNSGLIKLGKFCRYLTRRELEGAQNVPYGYTNQASYHQACDLLGDGWTVGIIAHILKGLK